MSWATQYIAKLKAGETVQFRPHGWSMRGRVESGQLCTVVPAVHDELHVGDIVLCVIDKTQFLHLIREIDGDRFLIGNNLGKINGWIDRSTLYGKCIEVSDG